VNGSAFASLAMGLVGQRVYSRRVNPAIVEVEESAHSNGEVDRFVRPPYFVEWRHIRGRDFRRMPIDFIDKTKQHLFFFGQGGRFQVLKDRPYQFLVAE
jgi:hypothetical protein